MQKRSPSERPSWRVAERLEIELIHALTPQAKGRVERANQTLQDRLIKEMRLAGIDSIEAARAFVPAFIETWNSRWAVEPRDPLDAHRPWTRTPQALDAQLARQDERVLSKELNFSAGGTLYCIKTKGPGIAMRGARVTLRHFLDGALQVSYKDRTLDYTIVRQLPHPSPAEDEKTLDARVDSIIAAQRVKKHSPRDGHPAGCG